MLHRLAFQYAESMCLQGYHVPILFRNGCQCVARGDWRSYHGDIAGNGGFGVLMFIENEGALFRGPSRGWPTHVWSPKDRAFVGYQGNVPKTVDWGEIVDGARASEIIGFNVATLPPCAD